MINLKNIRCMCCILIFILFNVGCSTNQENVKDNVNKNQEISMNNADIIEMWTLYGEKMKELANNPDKEKIVITVNGENISYYEIESQRVYVDIFQTESLKDRIYSIIEKKLIEIEADIKNILVDNDEIEVIIQQYKEILTNGSSAELSTYINSRGITIEEYIEELRESEYKAKKREALYYYVVEKWHEEMLAKTDRTNSENISDEEFFQNYLDELFKEAKIIYNDKNIEEIMSK